MRAAPTVPVILLYFTTEISADRLDHRLQRSEGFYFEARLLETGGQYVQLPAAAAQERRLERRGEEGAGLPLRPVAGEVLDLPQRLDRLSGVETPGPRHRSVRNFAGAAQQRN